MFFQYVTTSWPCRLWLMQSRTVHLVAISSYVGVAFYLVYVKIKYFSTPLQSLFYQIIQKAVCLSSLLLCVVWHTPNGNYLHDLSRYTEIFVTKQFTTKQNTCTLSTQPGEGAGWGLRGFPALLPTCPCVPQESASVSHRELTPCGGLKDTCTSMPQEHAPVWGTDQLFHSDCDCIHPCLLHRSLVHWLILKWPC